MNTLLKCRTAKTLMAVAVAMIVLSLTLGFTSTASATVTDTSKLTAFKFNDLNANGKYDPGEPSLADWEFCLQDQFGAPYPNAASQICRTTNSSGFAAFSNLPVGGIFKIVETVKPGWTVTTPNPQTETVQSGSILGVPGPNPATIGGFTIYVSNPTPNTWVYTVPSNNGGQGGGLSHWVLSINSCYGHVQSITPSYQEWRLNQGDPTTGLLGIKWGASGSFTIVLDDNYPAGTVQAATKWGQGNATGDILGPICYPRFGNVEAGSLTVTKSVQLNGWPADGTIFNICIKGPSFPNGNETGACKTFSAGESKTWTGLAAGSYTVTESNPDANKWTVSGEGSVMVSVGQTASKTITNTRKMNNVTVTKTATTEYTRTNTYDWDIVKTVTPLTSHLFEGETGVLTYTVSVTPSLASQVDSGHRVQGTIQVHNPGPADTRVANVTDLVAGAYPASVTCAGVAFPKVLAAGQSFSCTYATGLPGAVNGTNVATAKLTNDSTFTGTANVVFGAPSNTIDANIPISVSDTYTISGATASQTLGTGITTIWSDTYTRNATCSTNLNYVNGKAAILAGNVARIVETGDMDDASAVINCYRPSVSKTATPAYATTYKWDIDKTVTPAQTDLFEGAQVDLNYTVAVTRSVDSQSYRVDGVITVSNPNPAKALPLTGVSDRLSSGQSLPVTCAATTVPAGSSIQCTYGGSVPNNNAVMNTASATAFTGIAYTSPSVPVNFTGVTPTVVNGSITVNDTQPSSASPWTFSDSGSKTYKHTVLCNQNAFGQANSYKIPVANTAAIQQTGQSDSANANVTCWRLVVSKTADPSYTQPYDWDIQKSVEPALIELIPGQTGTANYTVSVTKTKLDPTDLAVFGQINIQNPAPIPAVLTAVIDAINGQPVDSLNCGVAFNYTLAAGGTLTCSYSHAPAGLIFGGQNVATAKLNTGASFSGSAPVDFTNAKVTEVLPNINVDDTNVGGDPWPFSNSGVKTYPLTFDCLDAVYNQNNEWVAQLDNIATILETGDNASAKVTRICRVGDLEVTKVVSWGNTTPDQSKTFQICISGPSFPQGDCKTAGFEGGKLTWQDLTPGAYTVTETNPGSAWTVSGTGVSVNVPAGATGTATITNSAVIPASLGDYVWEDKNQNGIQDDDEPAIPDVTVNLLQPGPNGLCGDGDDANIGTTTTDGNGKYAFTNLLPGDYCVQVIPPLDFDITVPNAGNDPTKNSKIDPATGTTGIVTLNPGDNDPNQDAGLFSTRPTAIDVDNQPAGNRLYLPMLGSF